MQVILDPLNHYESEGGSFQTNVIIGDEKSYQNYVPKERGATCEFFNKQ